MDINVELKRFLWILFNIRLMDVFHIFLNLYSKLSIIFSVFFLVLNSLRFLKWQVLIFPKTLNKEIRIGIYICKLKRKL